ncbi:MAG: 4-phosphoerythronate dehydrogenase [Gammaproteobacteria bacterium]|nr:4-phosphoerythronate dehydrogenase [Gammaproteobacteria bacterium]
MKIVADKDIYRVEETFSSAGELVLLPGRAINNSHVLNADALIVRTTTQVNNSLIENSTLEFVGSATSGYDHIDENALQEYGIHFCHAPGINANAVVDYVFTALAWTGLKKQTDFRNQTIGIIGAGNVGSRLALKAAALGMKVSVYDPLLENSHALAMFFTSLEEVLGQDVVTLHAPLTISDNFPTYHMLNANRLENLKQGAVLINAARGAIVDNQALDHLLDSRTDLTVVLDVWEGEPCIHEHLAQKVSIATPHIAGYSLKGKISATEMVYNSFCNVFALEPEPINSMQLPIHLVSPDSADDASIISELLLQAYPIQDDVLKDEIKAENKEAAENFDWQRSNYQFRREFSEFELDADKYSADINSSLAVLGFELN